jgi:hypothetical protein
MIATPELVLALLFGGAAIGFVAGYLIRSLK